MNISESLIKNISSLQKPTIIAISGLGGAGKSSFSKKLGEVINAPVVGVDSFQTKGAFDTSYSLWEIMDYSRLTKEVLEPFLRNESIVSYGCFDAGPEVITKTMEVEHSGKIIIEGVGLFRPELLKYFTYKIWIDCPLEDAITRGKKRDREEYNNPTDDQWDGIWKKNDVGYLETFKPKEMADFVISNC